MEKYLIIGSNSFSGSNFVKLLLSSSKNKIFGISRSKENAKPFLSYYNSLHIKNFEFHKLDINKSVDQKKIINLIQKNKIKNIANFASQGMVSESFREPLDWYKTNLISTVRLVEMMKSLNINNYLHVTTPEVYGNIKKIITEESPKNPSTPYAISRHAMDLHLQAIFQINKFPVKFSRAANVYGPGQQLYRIIPKTIIKILKKEKIVLHGSGSSLRSFVHIDDINKGYHKILKFGRSGHSYHLSSKDFLSIKNIVKRICLLLDVNYSDHVIESKNDRLNKDSMYKLSSQKAFQEMNWEAKIPLEDGLLQTINWIKHNFNIFKKLNLEYVHKK